jgi:hypothetical protein
LRLQGCGIGWKAGGLQAPTRSSHGCAADGPEGHRAWALSLTHATESDSRGDEVSTISSTIYAKRSHQTASHLTNSQHRANLRRREGRARRKRRARRAARQARSRPLVDALKLFLEHQLTRLSSGSETAVVIRYGLRHWHGLARFLNDGRIELDTSIVERSMRPQALTRKNALFAGHDNGAESWAILASLIETCKLSDIEPQAYLADVLTRLVNLWPNNRLDELLPWAWAPSRQQLARAA